MRFISGVIFIVVAIGLFFGFTNPKYQAAQVTRAEVKRYDEALDQAKTLTEKREQLLERYNAFTPEELGKLKTLIPDSIDTVRLIIDVDNIAKKHDLSLLNIAVTEDSSGVSPELGPDTRQYGTMNLSFNVATTYDRFKTFLGDLERSLRILDVESITFGEPNPIGNTTYTVRVRTYWLK